MSINMSNEHILSALSVDYQDAVLNHTTTTIMPIPASFEEFMFKHSSLLASSKPHTDISPTTLSPHWSRLSRLLLLCILSVIGSVGNIFMISSVMIEDHLKKIGNAFIVNIALADLLVTLIVIPFSTILILAGVDNSVGVCRFQWFLTACVFIVTVLSILGTAIENYVRLCNSREEDDKSSWFSRPNTTVFLILLIWVIAAGLSGSQFAFKSKFEYCRKKPNQILPAVVVVIVSASLIPLIATFLIFLRMKMKMQRQVRQPNFKPSYCFNSDLSLAKTNFFSFVIFILFWMPFGVIISLGTTKFITNYMFYNSAWLGISKSCFYNIIYCLTHRYFRNAYANLFNYCCCKTTVSTSRRHRNDGGNRPTADVRVHIIPGYNMYSYTSPQRATGHSAAHWGKRDIHEL